MDTTISTLLAVAAVSILSFAGALTLVLSRAYVQKVTLLLVSLAAGTLVGDVFIHIIPELFAEAEVDYDLRVIIILGVLSFLVLERLMHWHHHHSAETEHKHAYAIGVNNIIADGIHNFVDGVVIGASFLAGPEIGVATTIAVILHEIPQELGDFGVLMHAGFKASQALLWNFASALLAVLGGVTALVVGSELSHLIPALLAFAAGGFTYIAIGDLFPELKRETNLRATLLQLLCVVVGVSLMFMLTYLEVEG